MAAAHQVGGLGLGAGQAVGLLCRVGEWVSLMPKCAIACRLWHAGLGLGVTWMVVCSTVDWWPALHNATWSPEIVPIPLSPLLVTPASCVIWLPPATGCWVRGMWQCSF